MKSIFEKLSRYFYHRWHLAVLDMDIGRWVIEPKPSNIAYLKAENANGRHILIQPHSAIAPYYLLVDDICWPLIQQQHQHKNAQWKPGRMLVETSNNNYQLWIHCSRPLSLNEKRYWLKKLKSDPGADPNNRWGRCPGFRNRKDKHRNLTGGYPLSKLIWIDWKGRVDIPKISTSQSSLQNFSHQPTEGGVCQHRKIFRSNYQRADESATDFAYAIALLRRGYNAQFVRNRILSERKNWNNHSSEKRKQHYLDRTIKRVKNIALCS
jgi:hypothetical protein